MYIGDRKSWVKYFAEPFIAMLPIGMVLLAVLISLVKGSQIDGFSLLAIGASGIGFGLFLFAKIRKVKRGELVTFGSKGMTDLEKTAYYLGYGIMVVSLLWFIKMAYL